MRKKKKRRKERRGFCWTCFFRGSRAILNFFLSHKTKRRRRRRRRRAYTNTKKKGRDLAKTHHHRQSAHSSRTPNGIIIDESASRAIRETRGVCDRPRVVVVRGNDPTVRRLGFGGHRVGLSAGVGPRRGQRLFEMERTGDAELRAQRDTGTRRVQGGMEVFRGEALVSLSPSLSLSLYARRGREKTKRIEHV